MKSSKKYQYQVIQEGKTWSTEVLRRVTARVTVVTKRQDGFASEAEAEAQTWGQETVAALLKKTNLGEMQKRRARKQD
jgi:hypothetical protein